MSKIHLSDQDKRDLINKQVSEKSINLAGEVIDYLALTNKRFAEFDFSPDHVPFLVEIPS